MGLRRIDHRIVVILAFLLVYMASLTFVYTEGDDAATVLYHALGRNAAIQDPYSPYHGMMDHFLSYFPAREPVIRVVSMLMSAIFACIFYLLLLQIAFRWFNIVDKGRQMLIAILFLLAAPEFFFFGLVYTPSVVGMGLILLGHVWVRKAFHDDKGNAINANYYNWKYFAGALIFGLGASFRWDTMIYGSTIFLDLALVGGSFYKGLFNFKRLLASAVWGLLALMCSYLFIFISGYDFNDMLHILTYTGGAVENQTKFTIFLVMGYLSIFGIFVFVDLLIGLVASAKHYSKYLLIFIISLITASPFIYSGYPKAIIYFVPVAIAIAIFGFNRLWGYLNQAGKAIKITGKAVVFASVLAPWVIGIEYFSDKAWGPGFEMNKPEFDAEGNVLIPAQKYKPVIGPGLVLPTQDGVRSVGGYAFVLLGGEWRTFYQQLEDEREYVFEEAQKTGLPVLQENNSSFITIVLARHGYTTQDPKKSERPHFQLRTFYNGKDTIQDLLLAHKHLLFDKATLDDIIKTTGSSQAIFYAGYSASMSDLMGKYPEAFTYIAPFSGIIDLEKLRAKVGDVKNK